MRAGAAWMSAAWMRAGAANRSAGGAIAGRIIGATPPRKDMAWPPTKAPQPLAEVSTGAAINDVARMARKLAVVRIIWHALLPGPGANVTVFPPPRYAVTYGLLRLPLAFGLPLCTRLGSRFAVGTGHLCQIKFWLMQLMQTSWVSPAQACGSPRVALDQRRVSPFSRAIRAITARVGPCAWAGLQAMVATRIFVSGCRRTADTLSSHAVGVKAISSLSLGSPLVRWPRQP